jgi:hypothetical protein
MKNISANKCSPKINKNLINLYHQKKDYIESKKSPISLTKLTRF